MLELERKEDYFIISGLRYETSEAMEIADFIAHTLHVEHMESQLDKDMRSSQQAEIDKEVGEWEYKAKFGDEGDY